MTKAKEQRTIELADLFRLKFLQHAQLSPDGSLVVYSIAHIDAEQEVEFVTLWLLSLETGAARQLTAGNARDTNPAWSPDGTQIAFLSTRGDKQQIYLIPVDGGEARPLTDMEQGVGGGPAWSPDGEHIAFSAGPAIKPLDRSKPYRITRHTYRFDGLGYLSNVVNDIFVIPTKGGQPKQLTRDGCHNTDPIWSPDGREILFKANLCPDSYRYFPRLKVADMDGNVRELVGDWGSATSAAWTPDGERVVFIGSPVDQPFGRKDDLWVIEGQGGEPKCRTASSRLGVGGFIPVDMPVPWLRKVMVTQDSRTAYVQVLDSGRVQIHRVALSGPEEWTPLVTGEQSNILHDLNDQHLLFTVNKINDPLELFVADLDGSNERQLTRINAELLAERTLPTIEHLLFSNKDGTQIEGWILKPPVGKAPYPTILHNHGGPWAAHGHAFWFDHQMLAGAGYAVLLINYRGSLGYGDEFGTASYANYGDAPYKDLMAGVDFAIKKGISDPDRLGCTGNSAGGQLTCWIVGQTNRFKAAVPENAGTDKASQYGTSDVGPWCKIREFGGMPHEVPEVYRRNSATTFAHRCKTPTLLLLHEADYRVPSEQLEQFYTILKASGCTVEMVRFPKSSHGGSRVGAPLVRRVQNEVLLDWMNHYVLGLEPDKDISA